MHTRLIARNKAWRGCIRVGCPRSQGRAGCHLETALAAGSGDRILLDPAGFAKPAHSWRRAGRAGRVCVAALSAAGWAVAKVAFLSEAAGDRPPPERDGRRLQR